MYRVILSLIIAGLLLLTGPAYCAMVYGHAQLSGETDHSGIQVTAKRCYLPSPEHTVYTNSAGYYEFDWLLSAWWTFTFSRDGFWADSVVCHYVQGLLPTEIPTVVLTPTGCGTAWKDYPYDPPGASFTFPSVEGRHDPFGSNPNEWWYVNFHLTGTQSGEEYGAMVAFFKPGLRIFAIADLDQMQIYSRSRVGTLVSATSCLDLSYYHLPTTDVGIDSLIRRDDSDLLEGDLLGDVEQDGRTGSSGGPVVWRGEHDLREVQREEAVRRAEACWFDRFFNKSLNGDLIPFEYHLQVCDVAREDRLPIRLNVDMSSRKPPLIVSGDGFIEIGNGWSGYYSHTRVQVEGTIAVHGYTEPVTGWAWIDHQWGDFLGIGHGNVQWEWFSIQLDDWTDIMVADVWVNGVRQGGFGEGLNLYDSDCNLEILPNYGIQQMSYWDDPVSGRRFATAWQITEPSRQIALTVEAEFNAQAISITPTQIFPVSFWEGVCTVSGTVGGILVSGNAYAELTHGWELQPGSLDEGARHADESATLDEPRAGEVFSYELAQNRPNPFNPTTTIGFTLPANEWVTLKVYDLQGREVVTLFDNKFLPVGVHHVLLNGTDLPSGVYFYTLVTPNFTASQKMLLVK
ncbi:T9SS type A sorting domain-containing protein [bacterium]|nr:T9SS type A sorting domain-containing protein [bacterium]MBU1984756.1 T9SS type A sorting domain-containing protein [bacterium]